jgi:hypothetical protein
MKYKNASFVVVERVENRHHLQFSEIIPSKAQTLTNIVANA